MASIKFLAVAFVAAVIASSFADNATPDPAKPAAKLNIQDYCRPSSLTATCKDLNLNDANVRDRCTTFCDNLPAGKNQRALCNGCMIFADSLSDSGMRSNVADNCKAAAGNLGRTQCVCGVASQAADKNDASNFMSRCNTADYCTSGGACQCLVDLVAAPGVSNRVNYISNCKDSAYACPSGYVTTSDSYADVNNGAHFYGGMCAPQYCGLSCPTYCNGVDASGAQTSFPNFGICSDTTPATEDGLIHKACISDADCSGAYGSQCICSWCGSGGNNVGFVCGGVIIP